MNFVFKALIFIMVVDLMDAATDYLRRGNRDTKENTTDDEVDDEKEEE